MQIPIWTSKQVFASVIAATSAIADRNCWSLECQCPIGQRDCIRKLSSSNRKRGLLANAMIRPGKLERLMIRLMITTLLFLALPSSLFFPRCVQVQPVSVKSATTSRGNPSRHPCIAVYRQSVFFIVGGVWAIWRT